MEGRKRKTKAEEKAEEVVAMKWQDKKELEQKEEELLRKDIEDLNTWVDMIETMNDQKLKEYLENCPADSKMIKAQKMKGPKVKPLQVKRVVKPKSSTSNGIMASVWKFHKN